MGIINPEDGLGPVIHENQIDPGRDFFIGLIPGYGFEAVVDPLERRTNSVGIIKVVNITMPLGTNDSPVAVRFGIALDLPDAIVPDVGENGTAVAAAVAEGGNPGDGSLGLGFCPGFEIQDPRAQRKSSGAQGRGFEKSSPGNFGSAFPSFRLLFILKKVSASKRFPSPEEPDRLES